MIRRLLAVAVLVLLPVAAPASADGRFTATIVSVDPAVPNTGETIAVTLEISNATPTPINDITVHLLAADEPLTGRSQIPDVLAGGTLPAYHRLPLAAASDLDLASGASTAVTLNTSASALGLRDDRPGAYLIGAFVRGTNADGRKVSLRPVTVLPWMPTPPSRSRLGVVAVWTATAPPARGANGAFVDDGLARDLAPDGRLTAQLAAMSSLDGGLWLLDPALLDALQALATGALIQQEDGSRRAASTTEMQTAADWLASLRAAVTTRSVAALPYGDLDVRTALKFGHRTIVERALAQSRNRVATALGVASLPLAVPLYGGAVTDSTWRFLARRGVSLALVSDIGYPATQSTYTPNTAITIPAFGSGRVLVVDQTTSASLVDPSLTPQARQQAFVTHVLMTYLERPSSERAITLTLPPDWLPGQQAVSVLDRPWVRLLSAQQASEAEGGERGRDNIPATSAQRRLNDDLNQAIGAQRMLARLSPDPAFRSTVADVVGGVFSRWLTGRATTNRYTPLVTDELDALTNSVRVVTRGEIVFGAESGVVPVTVANGLPVPIDITLLASGLPSVRVQSTGVTKVHINAGKRTSVEIPTRVTGSGNASLMLQLATSDGQLLNLPVILGVRSAAYARVASYLVATAFLALLLLIAINTVRRVRARRLGVGDAE